MDAWKLGIAFFGGIAVAQSFFLGVFLLVKMRKRFAPSLWLGLLLIGIALRIGKSIFYYLLPEVAHWGVALGGAGLFMAGPSLWYFLQSHKQEKIPTWHLLILFVPALLAALSWLRLDHFRGLYRAGNFHLLAFLALATWYYFTREWNGKKASIRSVLLAMLGILLTFNLQLEMGSIRGYTLGLAIACLILYALNFYILSDKDFFKAPKKEGQKTDPELQQKIVADLEKIFENDKIYQTKGLTVAQVSHRLNHPTYLVSRVIKDHFQKKFTDFVNTYRVEEVKSGLKDKENHYTIEAIAAHAGFSSTSSLYKAFKKETGITPQGYRKQFL